MVTTLANPAGSRPPRGIWWARSTPADRSRDVERGCGKLRSVELIGKLLAEIECRQLAAQSPIEHRFTAASHSWLSPANSSADTGHCDLFAWIGIVLYVSSAVDSTDELQAQFQEIKLLKN